MIKSVQILYHYTDINALTYILDRDSVKLRATNCLFLNDGREIQEGIDLLKETVNKQFSRYSFRDYFLTSFSGNKDNLSMWNMYAANGKGCAIGFKAEYLLLNNNSLYDFWVPCVYNRNDAKELLASKLYPINQFQVKVRFPPSRSNDSSNIAITTEEKEMLKENVYIETCLSCKNDAFHEENEYRCVIQNKDPKDICFREKNGIVVPYVEVKIPKEAIAEIIIGPTNKSELTSYSVLNMLKTKEYDWENINIFTSMIPYRG